ncbi:MAG TPA: type II secretion system F family protein [Tepidisphaeraceae bacterium]|jgi:type II secretory pathway component PulF|nr:type II secretion system F family protein [Tepidisphaeraceae bacterium]
MKYAYQACDASGAGTSGSVEAAEVVDAIETLRRQGLFVTDIRAGGEERPHAVRRRRMGRSRQLKNLSMLMRQLYVLTSSGTQLVDALRSLERQSKDAAWRAVIADVRGKVEQGSGFAAAMGDHSDCFDPVCRSLVAAGETGGDMEKMLDRIATLSRKQLQTRSAIVGAMIYPCLLVCVAVGVLMMMLLFVLPRFAGFFQSMDVPLPATTKFLMALSGMLQSYWWAMLGGLIALVVGGKFWAATQSGREIVHRGVLRMPIAGRIVKSFEVARIVRVLGVLVTGKVPLLEALGLARQTVGNVQYVRLVAAAEQAVTRGSTISAVFGESDLVSPSLVEAIRSGEQSGEMAGLLVNMADFLDEDNEVIVRSLTSILEPIILIALGLLVGFVALSMFLPMFDLTSMTQRGG